MNKLKFYWEAISNTGVSLSKSEKTIKNIRLCNQIALIVAIADFSYIFLFLGLGLIFPGLMLFPLGLLYASTILFNYFGRFNAARAWIICMINVGIIFYSFLFSKGAGLQLILFACLVMSWVLFKKSQKAYAIALSVVQLISYAIVEIYFTDSYLNIPPVVVQILYYSMVFVVFALLFMFIYRLMHEEYTAEQIILASNEELEMKAAKLQVSEEELQQSLEELRSQSDLLMTSEEELKSQQNELQEYISALETQSADLEQKNLLVEQANQYKSEFLSNMSHELRTPLNSILILAKLLGNNKAQNLNEKQVEFANTIYKSGNNLLSIINDILDLSKIESGKMELAHDEINLIDLVKDHDLLFDMVAREKQITYTITNAFEKSAVLIGDKMRLEQILRNLLSNAFKFTPENGQIILAFDEIKNKDSFYNPNLKQAERIISISVKDTGIGIPAEQQKTIFEAFKQADGSVSRKYGGTGLGLSITKELARIMGGDLELESAEGKGSTFTVYLPFNSKNYALIKNSYTVPVYDIKKKILIAEDDTTQKELITRVIQNHYPEATIIKVTNGMEVLDKIKAEHFDCVILDLSLPQMSGYEILQDLRENKIAIPPIIIHTGTDLTEEQFKTIKEFTFAIVVKNPLSSERILLELNLIFSSAAIAKPQPQISIIRADKKDTIVQKTKSSQLFFQGKTALIIDDDMRNIFATTTLLEEQGMKVISAFDGKTGLDKLDENKTGIDIILMDIMMPVMDGYETMKEIRSQPGFEKLPIIAFTAKSMMDDRNKCIEAGASDYISKPVDSDKLISLIKIWI